MSTLTYIFSYTIPDVRYGIPLRTSPYTPPYTLYVVAEAGMERSNALQAQDFATRDKAAPHGGKRLHEGT